MSAAVTSRIRLTNMCCAKEADLTHKILSKDSNVVSVKVSVVGRMAIVKHEGPAADIITQLNQAQLGASLQTVGQEDTKAETLPCKEMLYPLALIIPFATSWGMSAAGQDRAAQYIALATAGLGLLPILWKACLSLRWCLIDINLLMSIAVVGAMFMHQAQDACLVVVLLAAAHLFEEVSMLRIRNALKSSAAVATPGDAVLAETGQVLSVSEVRPGHVLAVRAGELVPVDGVVVEGECAVDESLMTGEAIPVQKSKDKILLGGTLVVSGFVSCRATASYQGSTFAAISDMVDQAQTTQARTEVLIDKFVVWYTPAIVLLSLGVAFVYPLAMGLDHQEWLKRGLVVLISACPCALCLAAPISSLSAIGAAAKHGMLIKSQDKLEEAGSLTTIAFDKTGTLTEGQFMVNAVVNVGSYSEVAAMKMAASLESQSGHPLASTIVRHVLLCVAESVETRGHSAGLFAVTGFTATEGRGVLGSVAVPAAFCPDGHSKTVKVEIGNASVVRKPSDLAKLRPFLEEHRDATVLFVVVDGALQCALALSDQVRAAAAAAVGSLHKAGIATAILTGDAAAALRPVQRRTGVVEGVASCKPSDKLRWVKERQAKGEKVALIGDGMNDTPALTECDIGMAMGAGGSALAVKAADVVFLSNELQQIPDLIALSRLVKSLIVQNVLGVIAIKGVVVVMAIMGRAPLWAGVVADSASLVAVLFNGSRPFCFRFTTADQAQEDHSEGSPLVANARSYGAVDNV